MRAFGINYAIISALTFFMFWFYQSLLARYDVLVAWFGFVGSAFNLSAMVGVTNLTLLGRPCFRPATAYLAASRVAG